MTLSGPTSGYLRSSESKVWISKLGKSDFIPSILLVCFVMFSFFKRRPLKAKRFYHWDVFSLEAPENWRQNESPNNLLSITAPSDAASVTAASYEKEGATLSEFAQMRFSAVHECFAPIDDARQRESNGLQMVVREYEGLWPGNRKPNSYLVACIQLSSSVFVSLAITTRPKELKKNRKIFDDIINSVRRVW